MLEKAGFSDVKSNVVDKEPEPPHFQTLLALAKREAAEKA